MRPVSDAHVRKLIDVFDVDVLDDLGHVQQNRDEMAVLCTLLAERDERSVIEAPRSQRP